MIIKDYSYKVQLGVGWDDLTVTHHQSPVVQSNSYYPFGMQHATSWTRSTTLKNNRLYNAGSDYNEHTKNYETFYRQYDPAIGRFTGVDMLAGMFPSLTPYRFGFNNPLSFNDPLGLIENPGFNERTWSFLLRIWDSTPDDGIGTWSSGGGYHYYQGDGRGGYTETGGYGSTYRKDPHYRFGTFRWRKKNGNNVAFKRVKGRTKYRLNELVGDNYFYDPWGEGQEIGLINLNNSNAGEQLVETLREIYNGYKLNENSPVVFDTDIIDRKTVGLVARKLNYGYVTHDRQYKIGRLDVYVTYKYDPNRKYRFGKTGPNKILPKYHKTPEGVYAAGDALLRLTWGPINFDLRWKASELTPERWEDGIEYMKELKGYILGRDKFEILR